MTIYEIQNVDIKYKIFAYGLHIYFSEPPSAPVGPVKFSDATLTSVILEWRPPRDTGRSEITGYKIYIFFNNSWTCLKTVDSRTLKYTVKEHIKENHKYYFRITALNKIGESQPLESNMYAPKKEKGKFLFYVN